MKEFENKMDAYLNHEMSELERELFEKELKEDPEKKKMFEEHKEAVRLIKMASLKNKLDQLESSRADDEIQTDKKTRVIPLFTRPQLIGIAASLIVLVVAALWIFIPSPQSPAQLAFQDYYQKDPGLPTTMGVSEAITLDQAMLLYKQGEYVEAEKTFDELIAKNPSDTVLYYKAMTLIERNEFEQAEKILQKSQLESGHYGKRADWYLALILLKQDQKDDALSILKDIARTENHVYKNEAVKLIEDLE